MITSAVQILSSPVHSLNSGIRVLMVLISASLAIFEGQLSDGPIGPRFGCLGNSFFVDEDSAPALAGASSPFSRRRFMPCLTSLSVHGLFRPCPPGLAAHIRPSPWPEGCRRFQDSGSEATGTVSGALRRHDRTGCRLAGALTANRCLLPYFVA